MHVQMYRDPKSSEWAPMGEIYIQQQLGATLHPIKMLLGRWLRLMRWAWYADVRCYF